MEIGDKITRYTPDIIEDIRRLVSIRSVQAEAKENMPFGLECAKALNLALKMGQDFGFRTKNLDNYCGYIEMGEGEDLIGMLCHVDVVAEGENWTYAPYGGELDNGVLYGRGVSDDKGPFVIALYAMKIIEELAIPLGKRVRLVVGANEESGSLCMKHYKKHEEAFTLGFSPDADFPLIFGEKGIFHAQLRGRLSFDNLTVFKLVGGEAMNVVAPKCTCVFKSKKKYDGVQDEVINYCNKNNLQYELSQEAEEVSLSIVGVSAHASTPEFGVNAISHMMALLGKIDNSSTFVRGFNSIFGVEYTGQMAGIMSRDEYGELTLNIGLVSLEGESATMSLDIRYPITQTFDANLKMLSSKLGEYGISITDEVDTKPLFVDPNSYLVQTLYSAYKSVTKDEINKPFCIGGGTYAKEFENVVAFGTAFPGENTRIHMSDEFLTVDALQKSLAIYVEALSNLLK